MPNIEIIKGDINECIWSLEIEAIKRKIDKKDLTIPYTEIIKLNQKEKIGNILYVDFELGSEDKFTAKMTEKEYKKLYELFLKVGNNPQHKTLPIETENKSNFGTLMLVILGVIILIGISNNSGSVSNGGSISNRFGPVAACEYLNGIGMPSRGWKKDSMGNGYYCATNYYDTDVINDYTLSNNIAYYVEGESESQWTKAKIIANVNTPKHVEQTQKKLIEAIDTVMMKLTGQRLIIKSQHEFFRSVHAGEKVNPLLVAQSTEYAYYISTKVERWNNGKGGYEYRVSWTKKAKLASDEKNQNTQ
jgi:hypothetical protein